MIEVRRLEYRCARCKEIFWDGEDNVNPQNIEEFEDLIRVNASETASHTCEDGGIGIGDFIGYSPMADIIYQELPENQLVTRGRV